MGQSRWSQTSFSNSLVPMVIADDDRRYVAANTAACLLMRLPEQAILGHRIDDLTPPQLRPHIEPLWEAFIREGLQHGTFELLMPDGAQLEVDYSATANVEPGQHLSILMFPSTGEASRKAGTQQPALLTNREREVLGMIAMGAGSTWIAANLGSASRMWSSWTPRVCTC